VWVRVRGVSGCGLWVWVWEFLPKRWTPGFYQQQQHHPVARHHTFTRSHLVGDIQIVQLTLHLCNGKT
jgi:hypothetical protein